VGKTIENVEGGGKEKSIKAHQIKRPAGSPVTEHKCFEKVREEKGDRGPSRPLKAEPDKKESLITIKDSDKS